MSVMVLLCIIITNCITAFITFKGVCLGLRWQVEVRQERPPTMESPVKVVTKHVAQGKQEEEAKNLVSEWLNGADERR